LSVKEDELERRVSILEARIRELEKRNGLLATILTLVSVTVFISLAAVFLDALMGPQPLNGPSIAIPFIIALLILLFILGRRTLESSIRKSVETLDEQA
jgi:uncharacterized membrane protein (DUF485 family)